MVGFLNVLLFGVNLNAQCIPSGQDTGFFPEGLTGTTGSGFLYRTKRRDGAKLIQSIKDCKLLENQKRIFFSKQEFFFPVNGEKFCLKPTYDFVPHKI